MDSLSFVPSHEHTLSHHLHEDEHHAAQHDALMAGQHAALLGRDVFTPSLAPAPLQPAASRGPAWPRLDSVDLSTLQDGWISRMNALVDVKTRLTPIWDLYPITNQHNQVRDLPAKLSEESGYRIMGMLRETTPEDLMNMMPMLSMPDGALDTMSESLLNSLTAAWGQLDAPEAVFRMDKEVLQKYGQLVGHVDWEMPRLHRLDPIKFPDPHATFPVTSETKAMAVLNSYRWMLPWVITPAITPVMNTMGQISMGLNYNNQPTFNPDASWIAPNPLPAAWTDPNMPEHPWQTVESQHKPWMDPFHHLPPRPYMMKSVMEPEMEPRG